ncbi:dihydroxyacetone phosphate acyltransferase [Condylostylus longicornis]|uniref:dihydroxyacetone phosphate acyltransferase n=1 Tax=Condylostylus longicornis TaxID=2530218 RepID=UPI00244E5768|nr:dihydroxyacetone phosphate acyltransferase [Condylostylus longicornis]XP_055377580.1 dihydroxyacetone phosphate acyltransferase [Condylostylus longicornis]
MDVNDYFKERKRSNNLYMNNFENIIEPGCEPRMLKEYKPKFAQTFNKYLTPNDLKLHVLSSPKIQNLIDFYAAKTNKTKSELEGQVKDILDEIGLDRNLSIIRCCGMCITAVSKKICSGIYVNKKSLSRVKEIIGSSPVLYLPSHRSYCDFILMSYICFHYEIEIPGIAAGMDFYSMFAMGTMLRKTGAFFMRRSFSGDEIYWDVFREYVHALITVYHIGVEFFVEGTRSRNFKSLVPKVGLLAMTLEPFFMGEVPDLTIVPIGVSYERLLEEQLFVYELLGIPKPKESTKGFFKALKIIDQRFGKMYLDFGEPISLREYLKDEVKRTKYTNLPNFAQKLDKDDINLVKKLAMEIVYQQQQRIVITTFNLIVLYYSYYSYMGKGVNIDNLSEGVALLKDVFECLGAMIATKDESIKAEIIDTLEIHSNILKMIQGHVCLNKTEINVSSINMDNLKGYKLSKEIMEQAVPCLSIQLYINACMYWLSVPAITTLSAKKICIEYGNGFTLNSLKIKVEELLSIYNNEFVIVQEYKEEDYQKTLNLLQYFKVFEIDNNNSRVHFKENEVSKLLLSTMVPFLCMYYRLTETIILQFSEIHFTEKQLLIATQKHIESLLNSRTKYTHPYCLALDNLSIAITSLVNNSILYKIKNGNDKITKYGINLHELKIINTLLENYCNVLPFDFIPAEYKINKILAKL